MYGDASVLSGTNYDLNGYVSCVVKKPKPFQCLVASDKQTYKSVGIIVEINYPALYNFVKMLTVKSRYFSLGSKTRSTINLLLIYDI